MDRAVNFILEGILCKKLIQWQDKSLFVNIPVKYCKKQKSKKTAIQPAQIDYPRGKVIFRFRFKRINMPPHQNVNDIGGNKTNSDYPK